MSVNIMDLVKGAVSNQVMGQIGGLLGTDAKKTPSLFETAAGSILGGLMKKGSTAQGAQDIFGAVEKQDSGILDKLGDLLGGGDATDAYQKQGSGILDMVMGGGQQSSGMIGMVASALGLDKGIAGKLLMMAAPIIMGVIGKHIKSAALDAVGLGKLLGDQKSHLASVMPSSLTSDLGFTGLVGKAGDMAGSAVDAVGNAGGAALGAVSDVGGKAMGAASDVGGKAMGAASGAGNAAASAGGSVLKYLIPLGLLALAAIWGIPKLMDMQGRNISAPEVSGVSGMDFGAIPGMDALGETGTTLTGGLKDLTSGLEGVTDVEGAERFAGKITDFTNSIDGMGLDKLDGVAKTATSTIFGKFIETIKGLLSGKSEGIQGVLQPAINTLMEKLSPFSG